MYSAGTSMESVFAGGIGVVLRGDGLLGENGFRNVGLFGDGSDGTSTGAAILRFANGRDFPPRLVKNERNVLGLPFGDRGLSSESGSLGVTM